MLSPEKLSIQLLFVPAIFYGSEECSLIVWCDELTSSILVIRTFLHIFITKFNFTFADDGSFVVLSSSIQKNSDADCSIEGTVDYVFSYY